MIYPLTTLLVLINSQMMRNAMIGLLATIISDIICNIFHVVKVVKQSTNDASYSTVIQSIVDKDGYAGLFGRGLLTRILTNSLQGVVFTVMWKYFADRQSVEL